jgi:predicted nucleic acid-binding protein
MTDQGAEPGSDKLGPVVLDTNILIAAGFKPASHAAQVVRAIRNSRLRMVWCEDTRRESKRLLRKIPPLDWDEFADLFKEETRYRGEIDPSAYKQIPDPEDRVFAALAHAACATLITQDDHLLAHRSSADVPFLTAHEFVRFKLRDDLDTGRPDDSPS